MSPPKKLPDDFISVARRLECDEDKGRFEEKLGKIAKAKIVSKLPSPGGNRLETLIDKIFRCLPWIAGVLLILAFTPVGHIVVFFALFGAGALVITSIFQFEDMKTSGIKLAVAVVLFGLSMAILIVNPPRGTSGPDRCWDGRANSLC